MGGINLTLKNNTSYFIQTNLTTYDELSKANPNKDPIAGWTGNCSNTAYLFGISCANTDPGLIYSLAAASPGVIPSSSGLFKTISKSSPLFLTGYDMIGNAVWEFSIYNDSSTSLISSPLNGYRQKDFQITWSYAAENGGSFTILISSINSNEIQSANFNKASTMLASPTELSAWPLPTLQNDYAINPALRIYPSFSAPWSSDLPAEIDLSFPSPYITSCAPNAFVYCNSSYSYECPTTCISYAPAETVFSEAIAQLTIMENNFLGWVNHFLSGTPSAEYSQLFENFYNAIFNTIVWLNYMYNDWKNAKQSYDLADHALLVNIILDRLMQMSFDANDYNPGETVPEPNNINQGVWYQSSDANAKITGTIGQGILAPSLLFGSNDLICFLEQTKNTSTGEVPCQKIDVANPLNSLTTGVAEFVTSMLGIGANIGLTSNQGNYSGAFQAMTTLAQTITSCYTLLTSFDSSNQLTADDLALQGGTGNPSIIACVNPISHSQGELLNGFTDNFTQNGQITNLGCSKWTMPSSC